MTDQYEEDVREKDYGIRGGQMWQQKELPYMIRYVVLGPPPGANFILLGDPREQGGMVCTTGDSKWSWTPAELYEHFKEYGYACQGQLRQILLDEKEALIHLVRKEAGLEDHNP